jgi:hypothetical protein
MFDALAALFLDPIPVTGLQRALLLLPICLSISVVYKTLKCPEVADIPKATLGLWVTIVAGMWAVAVALWLLYQLLA